MTISAQSLVDSLYVALRQKLQFSRIGPDDRLADTGIAAAYGTSRGSWQRGISPERHR
jgi:hypothetical protein